MKYDVDKLMTNAGNSMDATSLLAPHVPAYEQILLCPIPTSKQHERQGRQRP